MRCQLCKKKCGIPMDCKYCKGGFCPSCLHLEKHNCSGIEKRREEERKLLEKKLSYEPTPKHLKI